MLTKATQNFSIIIPTFHEVKNIPALAKRLSQVDFRERQFEVILMDDQSDDGSVELVKQLQQQYPWLKMIVRQGERDLSLAILEGFQHAKYDTLMTMDADLSHPAEKIPDLLTLIERPEVDVVFGSRYVSGGSVDETWRFTRRFISRFSAAVSKHLLPCPIQDPLSGFMAIKRETVFSGAKLKPIGWKVGLEIMVKCPCKVVREVPIHFSQRHEGYSKLTLKIGLDYFLHVLSLSCYKWFALR